MIRSRLARLPLRHKMMLPTWLMITLIVIGLGTLAIQYVVVAQEKALERRIDILGQGVANTLQAALMFDDAYTAKEQLTNLSFDPDIISAVVINQHDKTIALIEDLPAGCHWQERQVICSHLNVVMRHNDVLLGDEKLGALEIWVSLENLLINERKMWLSLGVIVFLLSLCAWALAKLLHSLISLPLLSLHRSVEHMSRVGVLRKTLPVYHQDEVGKLTECFNEMTMSLAERESQVAQVLKRVEDKNRYIHSALDAMQRCVLVVSSNHQVTYFNPIAAKELKGMESNSDARSLLMSHFEPMLKVERILFAIDTHTTVKGLEVRSVDKTKRYLISCNPMDTEKSSLIQLQDITEQTLSEQRRKLLDLMFDQNQDAILVLNRALSVQTQNQSATQWFGEVNALKGLELFSPFEVTKAIKLRLLKTGHYKTHVDVKNQQGRVMPCELKVRALKSENGRAEAFVVSFTDLTIDIELKRLNYQANHDPLTGLANRSKALRRLQEKHDVGASQHILFLDLDGFKAVNDQYGHAVGDQLLKAVAQRLVNCVARRDLVSRLAGDEFLIAVREASSCEPIANRIIESLAKPFYFGDITCYISASIGMSYWAREDNSTLDDQINAADMAMYLAKKGGKNQYQGCLEPACILD
ncbi:GGDEF domain-containing protein [Vibrio jasicida]|uniref:diguanylate cyclase domain-containing protein n=1 Tax=Vibrio jasicida TaxID=766224 RepID=UPI000CF44E78|nr:diguanylate cyclase [Vibrio jasicida]PQJ69841.1 GGDEF domain-containing protein [Vibrio jasicida]